MAKTFVIDTRGKTLRIKDLEDPKYLNATCARCDKKALDNGNDACLGTLPGVRYACCGHGNKKGYIMFNNGLVVRGYFNVEINGGYSGSMPKM